MAREITGISDVVEASNPEVGTVRDQAEASPVREHISDGWHESGGDDPHQYRKHYADDGTAPRNRQRVRVWIDVCARERQEWKRKANHSTTCSHRERRVPALVHNLHPVPRTDPDGARRSDCVNS